MFVPNWTEHPEPGRRELDDPEAVVEREVGVEPPPEALVERLRAVDVRDRDDDDLELQVDASPLLAVAVAPSLLAWTLLMSTSVGWGRASPDPLADPRSALGRTGDRTGTCASWSGCQPSAFAGCSPPGSPGCYPPGRVGRGRAGGRWPAARRARRSASGSASATGGASRRPAAGSVCRPKMTEGLQLQAFRGSGRWVGWGVSEVSEPAIRWRRPPARARRP